MPGLQDMTPEQMLNAAADGTLALDGDELQETQQQSEQSAAQPAAQQEQGTDNEQEKQYPDGAVIISKSGAYEIPFEELDKARTAAKAAKAEVQELRMQLQALTAQQQANLQQAQTQAQEREDAGQAATQADSNLEQAQAAIEQGVDASVFGDFSEDALAKGIATLQQRGLESLRAQLKQELMQEMAPLRQKHEQEVSSSHYSAIYAKHPDADEFVQSKQFQDWTAGLPSVMRDSVATALQRGTTAQVIEVFDAFKAALPGAAPAQHVQRPTQQPQVKAAPQVQRRVPNSLSEIEGVPHADMVQQTLQAAGSSPGALLDAVSSMSAEQIERLMNAV